MTPRLSFGDLALEDVEEGRQWYEAQLPGLGAAFLAELEAAMRFVRAAPEMYPVVPERPKVRRVLLHRFPYRVFYRLEPSGDILVLACLHVRQEVIGRLTERGDV